MIISTIPLPNSKLPNVAVRSPMLDDQDILTIQQKVFELKEKEQEEIEEQENRVIKQNPQKDIQGAFYNLLSKERIELDYPAKDWEDAIRCAGKILYDTKTVTEQYVEEMVNSVKNMDHTLLSVREWHFLMQIAAKVRSRRQLHLSD